MTADESRPGITHITTATFGPRGAITVTVEQTHPHLTTGEYFAVDNGLRGTITDFPAEHLTVQITGGEHVVLDDTYLEHGLGRSRPLCPSRPSKPGVIRDITR